MVIGQQLSSILQSSRLRWSANIGSMHYRNNILAYKDTIIVSTSGETWNEPDSGDGVVCLNAVDGSIRWRFRSAGDANQLALIENVVIGGTDAGQIFALRVDTGDLVASTQLESPVVTKAVVLGNDDGAIAVLLSTSGETWSYVPRTERFELLGKISGTFLASPATSPELASSNVFLAGSDEGAVYKITVMKNEINTEELHQIARRRSSEFGFMLEIRGIGSVVVNGTTAVISYLRDTSDRDPPLLALDVFTGKLLWHGRRVKTVSKNVCEYGNARTTPVIGNGYIYSTFSYNDALHAFSLKTGKGEWMVKLDEPLFQNWASPIFSGDNRLIVPRANGVVHIVDPTKRKVIDAISVEIGRYTDPYSSAQPSPNNPSNKIVRKLWPRSLLISGIAATPLVYKDLLLVGGVTGELKAYRN